MSTLDELLHQISDPSGLDWRAETYDLALVSMLTGADRTTYVTKLVETAQQGDTRAILTLAHMKANEALPVLHAEAKKPTPWASVARRALVLLGQGGDEIDAIIIDALHAPAKMARVAAVMDLPRIGGPKAIDALLQALNDSDSAVRMLAWDGLVEVFKLNGVVRAPAGRRGKGSHLELLKDLLSSDIAAFNKMASSEMRSIFNRLSAGESPASLDLKWKPDPAPELTERMLQAMGDPETPYPVEELAKLTGGWRRRWESSLAMGALEEDLRVPEALVKLDATWTLPALEEMAASPKVSATMREKLKTAIRDLNAS